MTPNFKQIYQETYAKNINRVKLFIFLTKLGLKSTKPIRVP